MTKPSMLVIVGPTASGKTALAIELAQRYNGEIICADSRTVYVDMNIGTAKPTPDEQAMAKHWGIDMALPTERYTAAQFKRYATGVIADIRARGKLPIIVGGTGLYVDALLFDYDFPSPPSRDEQQKFERMTAEGLIQYCIDNNVELPEDNKNTRRLLKAIYTQGVADKRKQYVGSDIIVVGIATEKIVLNQRISDRTEHMFDNGVVEEARSLGEKYGWESEAMTSNVYRSIKPYLDGGTTIDEVKQDFIHRDQQLAKRQMTWFRRNPFIAWGSVRDIADYARRTLEAS